MTACLAILNVSRLISIDVVTFLRSFCSRTMSAASLATVPEPTPIEIPTSAVARAGASLTPSPTIITGLFAAFLINFNFSSGIKPA